MHRRLAQQWAGQPRQAGQRRAGQPRQAGQRRAGQRRPAQRRLSVTAGRRQGWQWPGLRPQAGAGPQAGAVAGAPTGTGSRGRQRVGWQDPGHPAIRRPRPGRAPLPLSCSDPRSSPFRHPARTYSCPVTRQSHSGDPLRPYGASRGLDGPVPGALPALWQLCTAWAGYPPRWLKQWAQKVRSGSVDIMHAAQPAMIESNR
jgi:hypothetical protein